MQIDVGISTIYFMGSRSREMALKRSNMEVQAAWNCQQCYTNGEIVPKDERIKAEGSTKSAQSKETSKLPHAALCLARGI